MTLTSFRVLSPPASHWNLVSTPKARERWKEPITPNLWTVSLMLFPLLRVLPNPSALGEKTRLLLEEGELDSAAIAPTLHRGSRCGRIGRTEVKPSGSKPLGSSPTTALPYTPTCAVPPRPWAPGIRTHRQRQSAAEAGAETAGSRSSFTAARSLRVSQARPGTRRFPGGEARLGLLRARSPYTRLGSWEL